MSENTQKNTKNFHKDEKNLIPISDRLEMACEGLTYISETDAAVVPFAGAAVSDLNRVTILRQTGSNRDENVEEVDFEEFFSRLTAIKDWHGEREKTRARKFLDLQELIEENLSELKVFKIGKIRLNIYAIGRDREGRLMGVRTKAVET